MRKIKKTYNKILKNEGYLYLPKTLGKINKINFTLMVRITNNW